MTDQGGFESVVEEALDENVDITRKQEIGDHAKYTVWVRDNGN